MLCGILNRKPEILADGIEALVDRLLQLAVCVLQPRAHRVDTAVNLGDTFGRGAIVFDRTGGARKNNERSGRKAGEQACND